MRTDYQLRLMVKRGGPERPEDIEKVRDGLKYLIQEYGVVKGRKVFKKIVQFDKGSIYEHLTTWPRGYQGDFQLLETLYNKTLSPKQGNWDMLFTEGAEAEAVRDRPIYLANHFKEKVFEGMTFMDVGCGSGLSVKELMKQGSLDHAKLVMVDQDADALDAAKINLKGLGVNVQTTYKVQSIISLKVKDVAVVWCAGVFDYLTDRLSTKILRSWLGGIQEHSEIIIGNMSTTCPNRDHLDDIGWNLRYRTCDQMLELGQTAAKGFTGTRVVLGSDKTGCNYFLHLVKGSI